MKVIFITDRTLKRFKTIENLNMLLNPSNQDLKVTIDGFDELRTRSWELSKALFGEDLTLGIRGEVNRRFIQLSYKEEKGDKPKISVLDNTVYVNVSTPSNAINLPIKDKVILASDVYDEVAVMELETSKTICAKLEQVFIENTFRTL